MANAFYLWVQAKNEADVEIEERMAKARAHYRHNVKKKVIQKWKVCLQIVHYHTDSLLYMNRPL